MDVNDSDSLERTHLWYVYSLGLCHLLELRHGNSIPVTYFDVSMG